MALQVDRGHPLVSVVERRSWRNLDIDSISADPAASKLIVDPSSDVTELSACHDDTLPSLTDVHAPLVKVTRRQRPTAPRYSAGCRAVKIETRRLERVHRRFRCSHTLEAWMRQSTLLRHYVQEQCKDYWTTTITENLTKSKLLWSQVSSLLRRTGNLTVPMTLRDPSVERSKQN